MLSGCFVRIQFRVVGIFCQNPGKMFKEEQLWRQQQHKNAIVCNPTLYKFCKGACNSHLAAVNRKHAKIVAFVFSRFLSLARSFFTCWVFDDKVANATRNWQQNKCNRINGNNARRTAEEIKKEERAHIHKKTIVREFACEAKKQNKTTNETNVNNNFTANQNVRKRNGKAEKRQERIWVKCSTDGTEEKNGHCWIFIETKLEKCSQRKLNGGGNGTNTTDIAIHNRTCEATRVKKTHTDPQQETSAWEKERHH